MSYILILCVLLLAVYLILTFSGVRIATALKADYEKAYTWIHNKLDFIARYWYWFVIGMFAVYFFYDFVADKIVSNNLLETKYLEQVTTKDIQSIDKLNYEINIIKSEQQSKRPFEYLSGALIIFVLSLLSASGTLYAYTKYKFLLNVGVESEKSLSVWSSIIIYALHFAFWSLLLITYLGN